MIWHNFILISIIFGTLRGYTAKKLVDRMDPFIMLFHSVYLSIMLNCIFIVFAGYRQLTLFPSMMILGIIFFLGYSAYLFASRISLSKSTVYSSYNIAISMLLASVFLGEWQYFSPTGIKGIKNIIGILIAFASMYLMFANERKNEKSRDLRWLMLIGINVVIMGMGTFFAKYFLASHNVLDTLLSQSVGIMPVVFFVNIFMKKKIFPIKVSNYILILINTVFDFVMLVFYYLALKNGPAVFVIPVQTVVMSIFVTLAGLMLFNEKKYFTKTKLVGLTMGIIGVILIVL